MTDNPFGQRTETTSPYLAVIGAAIVLGFAVFAFSFWPDSDTLRTDATGTQGPSTASGSRAK
jgi:hypothetical protein